MQRQQKQQQQRRFGQLRDISMIPAHAHHDEYDMDGHQGRENEMSVQALAGMAYYCAENDLQIKQRRRDATQPPQPPAVMQRPLDRIALPLAGREHRQANRHSEEKLRRSRVHNSQGVFQ